MKEANKIKQVLENYRIGSHSLNDACGNIELIISDKLLEATNDRTAENCCTEFKQYQASQIKLAKKLCEIYFNIAAAEIGEDEVRRRRDEIIKSRT